MTGMRTCALDVSSVRNRSILAFFCLALFASGCASNDDRGETPNVEQSALTVASTGNVLGFESADAWSASTGSVSVSDNHTQGAHSLSVTPRGYTTYTSAVLGSLSGVESQLEFDLWMPRSQPNPYWLGAAQLYVSIPSLSVYNVYLGQKELTGLPLTNWDTLSYSIPTDLVAKLKGRYADATFTIALNVPADATGTYQLDNLRFAAPGPESITVSFGDSPVNMRATEFYAPVRREDGSATPAQPVPFTIPRTIPVLIGSSGNGQATLSYRDPNGTTVRCTYRGGSAVEHPITDLERAQGRTYRFAACDNGAVAGSDASGTHFILSVGGGDSQDPAQRTTIELALGKGGCGGTLEPPISAEESVRIRDGFSWSQTRAVPETDAQGRSTLYYALLYLEDREQYQMLDQLLIHHSLLPIFDNELRRFDGQCGEFKFEGDGRGQFIYALLPGATYNLIRQYAVSPDPVDGDQSLFSVVKLLDVPDPRARNADGSVSWQALQQAGFYYMNQRTFPADDDTEVHQNPFLNSIRRRVSKVIAKAVRRTVRGIVEGLGSVDRFFAGSVTATAHVHVQNRDPSFKPTDPANPTQKLATDLTRAWGAGTGQRIAPTKARFEILQWLQFGDVTTPFPTGFSGDLSEDGSISLRVAKNRGLRNICVATTNDAAEITSFLTENLVCGFGNVDTQGFTHDIDVTIPTTDKELHVLTEMTDARAYLNQVVHYSQPHRAEVLDGWIANLLGRANGGAAFTPCFDFPNIGSTFQISVLNLYYGGSLLADGVVGLVEPYTAVDMILPSQNDGNFDSRGVAVHEYGHFTLCSLLYDRGFFNISIAYVDAAHQRTASGTDEPPPDSEGAYINEAFADFIADQVVGGTNYFGAPHSLPSENFNYCNDTGICLDTNFSDRSTFRTQISRVETTLHDAFDGHGARKSDVTGDGDLWQGASVLHTNDTGYGDSHDESIALPGQCLPSVINRWDDRGELLRDSSFLGGLADTMKDPACGGANWCQVCQLFALHQGVASANPNDAWAACAQMPVSDWIGAPPSGSVNLDSATCSPCAPHQQSVRGSCVACAPGQIFSAGTCQGCPSGTEPVAGQDACCAPGQKQVNGQCVAACPSRQVFQGGLCVACPESNIIVDNLCVGCPEQAPFRLGNTCVADCDPQGLCAQGATCLVPDANNVCQIHVS